MQYWTYAEIKDKIQQDMGLEQEDFISPDEMMRYCNEAIDIAESLIHTLYEDYFLATANINLVAGQAEYTLPSNIYANKIRHIMYVSSNTDYYPLRRMRKSNMFEDIYETNANDADMDYRYIITNSEALTGPRIYLVPTPRENITNGLRLWYIRNANTITGDASVCDIPEFASYILQYMKVRVYEKYGDARYSEATNHLNFLKDEMVTTLSNMVDDGDTELEKDLTFYEDMV